MLEETGLDIEGVLREQDFIDAQLGDQDTRLFIVQVSAVVGEGRGGDSLPCLPGCLHCLGQIGGG